MRDAALDPVTGDLLIVNHAARLTAVGSESVRQRLKIRLQLWRGEYPLDLTIGIPYRQFIGQKGALDRLRTVLRNAAATCPGIASLDTFTVTLGRDRVARVTLSARTITGEPVTLADFVVSP